MKNNAKQTKSQPVELLTINVKGWRREMFIGEHQEKKLQATVSGLATIVYNNITNRENVYFSVNSIIFDGIEALPVLSRWSSEIDTDIVIALHDIRKACSKTTPPIEYFDVETTLIETPLNVNHPILGEVNALLRSYEPTTKNYFNDPYAKFVVSCKINGISIQDLPDESFKVCLADWLTDLEFANNDTLQDELITIINKALVKTLTPAIETK